MNVRVATSLLLTLVLVLTACSDDGDPEEVVLPSPTASAEAPDDEPTPSPSPTASAEAPEGDDGEIDVTTIPDEITPAYVEAVYDEINAGRIEYDRAVLSEPVNEVGAVPSGTRSGLENWLTGTQLRAAIAGMEALAQSQSLRDDLLPPTDLTGFRADVLRIVAAEPTCIVAIARLDESGVRTDGGPQDVLVALSFAPKGESAESPNPTPWLLADQLRNESPEGEPNDDDVMLDADLALLESSLDTTCGEAAE